MPDAVMFSVLVKVDVLLHTAFSSTDVAADTYTVAGPEDVTTLLRTTLQKAENAQSPRKMSKAHTDHGSRRGVLTGRMSPLTPVTVPPVARAAAGIPLDATHFAFIYPLEGYTKPLLKLNLGRYPWGFLFLAGGFGYFDGRGKLISINAVTPAQTEQGLWLVGVHRPTPFVVQKMLDTGRMCAVLDDLGELGYDKFGWVHPSETFDGCSMSETQGYVHGAFLYILASGEAIFYELSSESVHAKAAFGDGLDSSSAMVTQDEHAMLRAQGGSAGTAVPLSEALTSFRTKADEAWRLKEQAGRLTSVARAPPPRVTLSWEMLADRANQTSFLVVVGYLWLGAVYYKHVEDKDCVLGPATHPNATEDDECLRSWTYTDAIYFAVTTMTTVGYGDLAPSSTHARFFTAFYILIGVTFILDICGRFVHFVIQLAEGWFQSGCACVVVRLQRALVDENGDIPSALSYYVRELWFYVVMGFIFSMFWSAYVFTQLQDDLSYGTALWHCWITATTVGYGDVSLTTEGSRQWATVHILWSVSWLAGLITHVKNKVEFRTFQLQRAESNRCEIRALPIPRRRTPAAHTTS